MIVTSLGLPYEIYDLMNKVTVLRVVAFVINLALVLYLVLTKRLFGVRGGKKAYEAHLRSESILDAEMAALDAEQGVAARQEPTAQANAAGNPAPAADRPAAGPPWPNAETPAGPSSAAAAPAINDAAPAPAEPAAAEPAPAPAETADEPAPGDAADEPAPPPLPRRRRAR
jgi:hypothetical protein